jgi:DNA-binding FadR family transcriptional regulator
MIEKTSTVEALVTLLTDRIHSRVYKPGTKLPSERKLQEEFGVGRLALREALSQLNAMGIIETSHGKGTFVQDQIKSKTLKNVLIPYFALKDSRRLKEFVDARVMIESEIAGLAAKQHTEDDLRRLDAILNQEIDATTPPEVIAYMDLQFHQELALIVDNHFLVMMNEALTTHIRSFLNAIVKNKENPAAVFHAHGPILEAIKLGNAEEARKRMRQHILYSLKDYEDFVKKKK